MALSDPNSQTAPSSRSRTRGGAEASTPEAGVGSPERVLGLDNVPIDLPVSRVGSRILAATVDYTLLTLLLVAWVAAAIALSTFIGLSPGWAFGIVIAGMFLIDYGYFALQEVLWNGQTLGKRALHLRVVSRDGSRADTSQLVLRNLVRSIDVLVGALLMAIDPLGRRLGDRLAGTLVVNERRAGLEVILARVPADWEPSQVEIVEAFLRRAPMLEESERDRLGRRLIAWVENQAPGFLPSSGADPLERLEVGFLDREPK